MHIDRLAVGGSDHEDPCSLDRPGGHLRLIETAVPEARPGTVVLQLEASGGAQELVTPLDGISHLSPAQLATAIRFIVPYGGRLRGRLAAGDPAIVTGATGSYGSAAVLLALALGAARVVAAGRDAAALAARHALRRNGRLVLMGSARVPIPIDYMAMLANNWELIGQFMYPADGYLPLFELVRAGLLDLTAITPHVYRLAELPAAMAAAASVGSLACVVMTP